MDLSFARSIAQSVWWGPPSDSGAANVARVRDQAADLEKLSSQQLITRTHNLRAVHSAGKPASNRGHDSLQRIALILEAVRRTTGKTYYDVQLMGGMELTQGRIAQMQTGEGKTLTTAIPAVARALLGQSVHVSTTNSYLAERDCAELRPPIEALGLTVGLLPEEQDPQKKREAYACDITFGTGFEFGFDFLRDQQSIRQNRKPGLGQQHIADMLGKPRSTNSPIQAGHQFAIVDEADSVLIDEATMPLILSSAAGAPPQPHVYALAQQIANQMTEEVDFQCKDAEKSIELTETGWQVAHDALRSRPALPLNRQWSKYIENALRVRRLLHRDVDYVVIDGEVHIVDQHTGRIHEDRTWRDGLHQAIETKEQVEVTAESNSDARITRQRYYQCYDMMCGMTGTAGGVEAELQTLYGLSTVAIPTHRPCLRETLPLRAFADNEARNAAIVDEVKQVANQRPVLIGTRTIRHSLELARRLDHSGISHTVLNGLQDEGEAAVVSRAGATGAVTIATNMAGRGTDIRIAKEALVAGGLHVIGAEPNLSQRVDRQLAGRAARQGDPGSVRFFAAASDEIFVHDSDASTKIMASVNEDGEATKDCTQVVSDIQTKLEERDFKRRQQMVARDHWLDDVLQTLVGRN